MEYKEVRDFLEEMKQNLEIKVQDKNLSPEEREEIKKSIVNYDYIIELTDMNHYERGSINQ